jgi:hypothetical protein
LLLLNVVVFPLLFFFVVSFFPKHRQGYYLKLQVHP